MTRGISLSGARNNPPLSAPLGFPQRGGFGFK